jgi:hypothetical protein
MKKIIRLTESDLHRIVRQVVNEIGDSATGQRLLGAAQQRAFGQGEYDKSNNIRKYAWNQREKANKDDKRALNNGYDVGRGTYWARNQAPLNQRMPQEMYNDIMHNGI